MDIIHGGCGYLLPMYWGLLVHGIIIIYMQYAGAIIIIIELRYT